ncbi:MAG TPA: hypothetical protein VIL23_00515 [Clostridia bacterium]
MTDSQDIFILLLMVLFLANQNACCDLDRDEFDEGVSDFDRFCNINDLIILMLILFTLSGDSFCHHRNNDSDVAGVSNYNCARRNMNCRNN